MDILSENNSQDNKTLNTLKYDLVRDGLVTYDDIEHATELAGAQNTNIGQISGLGTILSQKNSDFQLFSTIGAKSAFKLKKHFSLKIS